MSLVLEKASAMRGGRTAAVKASPRPRVLHLITNFEIGGTERQAVELLKRLDVDRYELQLAAIHADGPLYSEISSKFPCVVEFPLTSFYNANAAKQFVRLRSWLISQRIDILHAHDFYAGILGVIGAQFTGIRIIASQRHLQLSDRWVHIWSERLANRFADRVLVNSEAIRQRILSTSGVAARKIVLIRNGIRFPGQAPGVEAAHGDLCRELGLDTGVRIVGSVAKMRAEKGHSFFIEAARRIIRSMDDVHFVLVGDGPLRHEIESKAKEYGIRDRLHLLGDRLDASRLCAGFDVAVLASLREGLPNTILEAMAARVPVVATAVGGVIELIQDGRTGYLARPADPVSLARQIELALRDRVGSARIAALGSEFVKEQFGMQTMVDAVERLYDELNEQSGNDDPSR